MNGTIENETELFQSSSTRYAAGRFAFAALALLFFSYQLIGGGLTLLFVGTSITPDNVMASRLSTMLAQLLFLLIPTIYLAKRQHGVLSDVFRWRIPSLRETILAVAGLIVLMNLTESYLYFQGKIPVSPTLAPFINAYKKAIEETFRILITARSGPEMLFVMTVAAVTPALCEELMFRGLIQRNLTLAYGKRKGFILAGAIFGLYHLNPFWIVPLASLGIYFSFLMHRSKTLLLPMAAHLLNNGSATIGAYIYGFSDETTPTVFMGTEGGPTDSMVFGTGMLFAVIFFLLINQYIKATEHLQHEQ